VTNDSVFSQFIERIPFMLAVAASTAWIIVAVLYVNRMAGPGVLALPPAELAILIAAFAAPLFALWLFVAVVEQRRALIAMARRVAEIAAQNRHSLQQAETQVRGLTEMQAQMRRIQVADTRRLALQDLAGHAAILAERLGVLRREDIDVAWARYGSGDLSAFVQPFLAHIAAHPDMPTRMAEAVARDPSARTALAGFVRRYGNLLTALADDKLAQAVIEEGAMGRAFQLFKTADTELMTAVSAPTAPPLIQPAITLADEPTN
jgi:hypothetical protein